MAKNKPTTKQLEQKFAETAFRLNQERNDFFLPQVQDFVLQRKWLNLRPEYQRRLVWDDQKRSLFIESLLLNVPIPPVFLYECDLSRYEVMDGQQRLNAVVDFYENLYPLRGLEKWSELNGLRYKELPETLRRGLDRRRISATVLLVGEAAKGGPDKSEVRRLVFERLNTGGQNLNAQELRNCLYAGGFNDLLIELASDQVFTSVWEIPSHNGLADRDRQPSQDLRKNQLYRRMVDCELILRFFAFRRPAGIKGSVRSILDTAMENQQKLSSEVIEGLRQDFKSRIRLAQEVFGNKTFRFKNDKGELELSQPLYDGIMVAIDRLWHKRKQIISARSAVVAAVAKVLKEEATFEVIVGRPNTASAIRARMDLLTNAIDSAL